MQRAVLLARAAACGARTARVIAVRRAIQRERLHQVVEEGELDLHQRAVAGVLAAQLVQQAAQPRAAGGGSAAGTGTVGAGAGVEASGGVAA